jgi:hypothetical protein
MRLIRLMRLMGAMIRYMFRNMAHVFGNFSTITAGGMGRRPSLIPPQDLVDAQTIFDILLDLVICRTPTPRLLGSTVADTDDEELAGKKRADISGVIV